MKFDQEFMDYQKSDDKNKKIVFRVSFDLYKKLIDAAVGQFQTTKKKKALKFLLKKICEDYLEKNK
jgi:hypothetical protein